jgi:hypothetical protein
MNIKHLEHLLALADTGSFSRAAEKLFITQSALSRSIQSLEDDLGGKVLDRIGKRNELTPLGRDVVTRARHISCGTLPSFSTARNCCNKKARVLSVLAWARGRARC